MFQPHKNRWRGRIDAVTGSRCPVARSMNQSSDVRQKKYINTEIALKSMCATQQCGEYNRNARLKCDLKHNMPFVIVFLHQKKVLYSVTAHNFLSRLSEAWRFSLNYGCFFNALTDHFQRNSFLFCFLGGLGFFSLTGWIVSWFISPFL